MTKQVTELQTGLSVDFRGGHEDVFGKERRAAAASADATTSRTHEARRATPQMVPRPLAQRARARYMGRHGRGRVSSVGRAVAL